MNLTLTFLVLLMLGVWLFFGPNTAMLLLFMVLAA